MKELEFVAQNMQPLPLDTESFWEIRTSDPRKLYVDKTRCDFKSHERVGPCVEEWKDVSL